MSWNYDRIVSAYVVSAAHVFEKTVDLTQSYVLDPNELLGSLICAHDFFLKLG